MPSEHPALHVQQVRYAYGARAVLDGVTLDVDAGTVCGLLGPNGSGKTTLFKCCMNILTPQSGHITLWGQSLTGLRPAALARLVAYVPQEHRQAFPFRVRDMVLMGRSPHMRGLFRLADEDQRQVDAALERVGLADLADVPCNQLSGGQRQLVLLARALAQQTPLLLLDEPTSALDFSNQMAVWSMIRAIAGDGKTVLVCCHDPNHILWFCDQAVMLHEGRVLADGPPQSVITTPLLHAIYGPCCVRSSSPGLASGMVCPHIALHGGADAGVLS